jgi:hypothetical protein
MGKPMVTGWLLGYSDGGTFTDARANYAVDGGYNVVWVTSPAELNIAQQHGLRAMYLNTQVINPSMIGTATLTSLITQVKSHPALYSYYVSDEPGDFAPVGNLVSYLRTQDPAHLGYVNVYPINAFNWAADPAAQYQTYLNQYMTTVQPSLLSYDNYQFMAPTTSQYLQNLGMISQTARGANVPFMNIVPACAVGGAPAPNGDQLRFLLYSTLAYGGTGIHYWFGGAGSNPSASIYSALTPLNHQFVAIGEQLQGWQAIGAYLKGYKTASNLRPPGTSTLPVNSPFQVDVADTVQYTNGDALKGILIGLFDGDSTAVSDASFALVQNIDNANSRTVTLTGPGNLSIFDATLGRWTPTGSSQATLSLLPGGGTLVGLTLLTPGANSTWIKQAGDWNSNANWSGGIPNSLDAMANFASSITAARSVYTDIATTLGTLNFSSANTYVLGGAGSLTMQTTGVPGAVNVALGSHKINLPLTFASSTNISIASGSTLTFGNPTRIKANKTVTNNGNLLVQAPLSIETGGALVLTGGSVVLFGAPALGSGAKIDLQNGSLTIDYRGLASPTSTILSQLTSGYHGGAWDGSGIHTSTGNAVTGLGWRDDSAGSSILIRRTLYGDANLDGVVDSTDFAAFLTGYGRSSGGVWAQGDFDYDGKVNTRDFNMLSGNFGSSIAAPVLSSSVVPEPASFLVVCASLLLRRR